jgi:hypothetical protein
LHAEIDHKKVSSQSHPVHSKTSSDLPLPMALLVVEQFAQLILGALSTGVLVRDTVLRNPICPYLSINNNNNIETTLIR